MRTKTIVVAPGDGIGPEIMESTLDILRAAGAPLDYRFIEVGEAAYRKGFTSGVPHDAWELLQAVGVLLKGPITTPQGKGFKSVNVTIRKTLNLYANIRPSKSYSPFVASAHPGMNLVIIRENEEDLYAGIEHRQTPEVTQVLKLVTRPGCENIVRYAFEYARAYGRRKVTCMTKDNIMKLTDGLFHQVFDEIAAEYPEIRSEHQIIDIGAQLAGSIGFAASANIGHSATMFEAVHGSAPDIAGKDVANPSGLLIAATQMLVHLGSGSVGETIKNAWLCTLEDGIHTADIYREGLSQEKVGTRHFTEAVIARLGRKPRLLQAVEYHDAPITVTHRPSRPTIRRLAGVDVFLGWDEPGRRPDALAARLNAALSGGAAGFRLALITNRGVKVHPEGLPETFCTDHWRCRFLAAGPEPVYADVLRLLTQLSSAGLEVIKTENLYTFDGQPGYSLGQGE